MRIEQRHRDFADLAWLHGHAGAGAQQFEDQALIDDEALPCGRLVGDDAAFRRGIALEGLDALPC